MTYILINCEGSYVCLKWQTHTYVRNYCTEDFSKEIPSFKLFIVGLSLW